MHEFYLKENAINPSFSLFEKINQKFTERFKFEICYYASLLGCRTMYDLYDIKVAINNL